MSICTDGYVNGLIHGDKNTCYEWVQNLRKNGLPLKSFYKDLFYPSMVHVGELWMNNEITVAQEHVATAITQHLMSTLYIDIVSQTSKEKKGKIIMACPENELHELGARMTSDLLEIEGWQVLYLGANTPLSALTLAVKTHKPDFVGISCTMPSHLDKVKTMIQEVTCQAQKTFGKDIPIFIGGGAFGNDVTTESPYAHAHLCYDFEHTLEYVNAYDYKEIIELEA